MKYPSINNKHFLDLITQEFQQFKIPKKQLTMEDICQPKKFKLQKSQEFVAEYLSPKSPYKSLLVFHQIGSGKTCTAVTVAEKWVGKRQIIVLTPASLIDNFKDELRSLCADDTYISNKDRQLLKSLSPKDKQYKDIILKSNKIIDKFYKIMSYHKFTNLALDKKINFKNTLLIIDEVQNMVSISGTFYRVLSSMINKAPEDLRIMLLSATPMFDSPTEIALTINLLRPNKPLPIGNQFIDKYIDIQKTPSGKLSYSTKNMDDFRNRITGYISYYRGAPPQAYPQVEIKVVRSKMLEFQYKSYLGAISENISHIKGVFTSQDISDISTDFMIGPRMLSNIAFPNKKTGFDGLRSLKGEALLLDNLKNYSIKFYKIIKKIKQSKGPCFIYSNFKEEGGIESLIQILKFHGWKDYRKHGTGIKRYAVWSGDENITIKDQIKKTFNNYNNKNGSQLQLILGSPSIKEGVTLLRVEQVHIIEPYWNMSRILQIIGRAVRYCSHKDLPKNRRFVKIYLHIATLNNDIKIKHKVDTTIDEHIWKIANKKDIIIKQFETALKERAVDCKLFYNLNNFDTDEQQLKCFK